MLMTDDKVADDAKDDDAGCRWSESHSCPSFGHELSITVLAELNALVPKQSRRDARQIDFA